MILPQMRQPSVEVKELQVGTVWAGELGTDPVAVSEVGRYVIPADEEGGVESAEMAKLSRMLAGCMNHHLVGFQSVRSGINVGPPSISLDALQIGKVGSRTAWINCPGPNLLRTGTLLVCI